MISIVSLNGDVPEYDLGGQRAPKREPSENQTRTRRGYNFLRGAAPPAYLVL